MNHLSDYIRWMRDFPISGTGFLEADAMVLCALSYIDFSPVFTPQMETPMIHDCLPLVRGQLLKVMFVGGDMGDDAYLELLALAAASRRFGRLTISSYRNSFREDPPLQFSAICFHDDTDFSFLAFRGTDSSLSGWKEDFMTSFMLTESQEMALQYAEDQICPGRNWYIGGHSKGGNLALYASSLLSEEKWDAVKRVYVMDAPGFCPEVFNVSLLDRVDAKTTQMLPGFSIIGNLFAPKFSTSKIIRSFANTVFQHDLVTWGIEYGKPAYLDKFEVACQTVNATINEWITGFDQEDRARFVDELFDILKSGGAESMEQILSGGLNSLDAIRRAFNESSPLMKQVFSDFQKHFRKVSLENLQNMIFRIPED